MPDHPGFQYADGMAIEMFDKVEVTLDEGGRFADPVTAEGTVTRRHPRKRTVRVRYETNEFARTTGEPVMATGEFPIDKIELVARSNWWLAMADKSKIEWTEDTWNPIVGCSVISPGCTNCYAMKLAARIERMAAGAGRWSHYNGTTEASKAGPVWTGRVTLAPDHILTKPLRRRKPTVYFVNSMGDLFHESVSDDWIDRVFAVMARTPQHIYQILTKRDDRMRDVLWRMHKAVTEWQMESATSDDGRAYGRLLKEWPHLDAAVHSDKFDERAANSWPLPNVWLGVSVEDRPRKERIDILRETPAALRFISFEPLLEDLGEIDLTGIGWAIIGGESGPRARPFDPDWARSIIGQCKAASVPVFMKQMGSYPAALVGPCSAQRIRYRDRKGGNPDEWPDDLRVREMPKVKE